MYDHLVQTTTVPFSLRGLRPASRSPGAPKGPQRRFCRPPGAKSPGVEKVCCSMSSGDHSAVVPVTGTNAFGRCRASTGLMRLLSAGQGERTEGGDAEDPAREEEADAKSLGEPLGGAGPAVPGRPGGRDGDQDG